MKKWMALLLAVMLLFSAVACDASEKEDREDDSIPVTDADEFEYSITGYNEETKRVWITGIKNDLKQVRVPAEIEGYPVVSVEFNITGDNLERIVLPEGVLSFLGPIDNQTLKRIDVPDSVIFFDGMFQNYPDVEIHTPKGSYADRWAKENGLAVITEGKSREKNPKKGPLPELVKLTEEDFDTYTVKVRGEWRTFFAGYQGAPVAGMEMPEGFGVHTESFYANTVLERIKINGGDSIGEQAFFGCTNLRSVEIEGALVGIGGMAFAGCISLQTIVFPEGLEQIGRGAFSGCYNLKSVTIPDSVREIGDNAFFGCDDLVIRTPAGSYAEQWAKENGVPVETF